MSKLSVIVPVYNCKNFLNQCVEAILSQSFTDYELLLIDDGSSDGSAEICDVWAERDERVVVYHIDNAGVSNARNVGLSAAKGIYVTFIDADDYVTDDFFYKAIEFMEDNHGVDYLQYSIDRFDENGVFYVEQADVAIRVPENFVKTISFMGSACFTIFKNDIISSNSIQFNSNVKLGEDQLFVYEYIHFCRKCAKHSDVVYHYRCNPASSTNLPNFKNVVDSIEVFKSFKYRDEYDDKINETLFSLYMQLVMNNEVSIQSLYIIGQGIDFRGVKPERKITKLFHLLDKISRKLAIIIVRTISYAL